MPAPKPQAAPWGEPTQLQQPQSTFAVISSRRCTQPHHSTKDAPLTMSALKRMKARIQALAASSKPPQPRDSYEPPEATRPPHPYPYPHPEGTHETAPLKTRIEDRLKAIGAYSAESVADAEDLIPAIGACSTESVKDTEDPIPAVPIPEETPNDPSTAPFDVHTTLLGRTAVRYAAARAFNLGLPAPDREELMELCDEIARRAEKPEIMWSLEGTYVPRGVPKGRVTRFVETGLLEVERVDEESDPVKEKRPEALSEEEDSIASEKAALAVQIPRSGRGRVRDLWKTRRRGRMWGPNCQDRLIKA
ncbi:hypothetical protein V500_08196 [Pseudogymnoascus sp. VKM F-4518 (FW-2643)]|nr:hypothetical protein V500_08196 [Pseudogymnoascus sp. VKM F-4518 (FW-2643)]